jgi:hypothetical protein
VEEFKPNMSTESSSSWYTRWGGRRDAATRDLGDAGVCEGGDLILDDTGDVGERGILDDPGVLEDDEGIRETG